MKPAQFDYVAPSTIEEACRLLAEAGGGATLLAGGQTLMPLLALRMSQPFIVIDLHRIGSLKGVSRQAGCTRVGPMLRQNDILFHSGLAATLPALVVATRHVGHHQTRNRGTIGGSISFGEPAAELPAAAIALDATLEVRSIRGTRRIAAANFYVGPYATVLEPDELLTAIELPDPLPGTVTMFHEVARRPGDFALVGVIGALTMDRGTITRATIAWFGMGATPIRATQAEATLTGQVIAALDTQRIADLAIAETAPFDDQHASAEYRRTVGRRIFARALQQSVTN
jgi:carbon-monoxide dehydrogenase medium subunit